MRRESSLLGGTQKGFLEGLRGSHLRISVFWRKSELLSTAMIFELRTTLTFISSPLALASTDVRMKPLRLY
jgi:hypothetical protein